MNYGELKTFVLADSHRTDLTAYIERFVRGAEGLIRRKCPNFQTDASVTLDDTDRGSDPTTDLYTLPSGIIEVRRVVMTSGSEEPPLHPVGPNNVALKSRSAHPSFYALLGNRLQIRGVPGEGSEFDVLYFGELTELSADGDTNAVLTSHEAVYVHGAKHYLRRHTEEWDQAADELELFNDAADALNELTKRRLGNPGAAPAYDFGGGGGY